MYVIVRCHFCSHRELIQMTRDQHDDLVRGEKKIQDILPEVSPPIREMFLSGMCPDCWHEMLNISAK